MTDTKEKTTAEDDLELLKQQHEQKVAPDNSKSDILAAAQLFNAVGSELTKVQKHNVDGRADAMKLDKNKVFSHQPPVPNISDYSAATSSPSPGTPPPQPGPPPPALQSQHLPISNDTSVVTMGVKEYEQQKKTISTMKRKLTKLEGQINDVSKLVNHVPKQCKYRIVSDNIVFECNNTTTLLKHLASELQSSPTSVTIDKC